MNSCNGRTPRPHVRIWLPAALIMWLLVQPAAGRQGESERSSMRSAAGREREVEYEAEDSVRVESLLCAGSRGAEHPMIYFGRQFLDVPYVAHTLENGDHEHLIVNLRELDCTTFVETLVALSRCDRQGRRTFADFCEELERVRYRQGRMTDYTSRLHYFTWWLADNERAGIVRDVCPEAAPWGAFTAVQTIHIDYMTRNPHLYKHLDRHPEFVPVIRQYEKGSEGETHRYIPKANLAWRQDSALGVVEDGDIIALLTDSDGLDTRHICVAFWQDGELHLLHASSLAGKVVMSKETLYEYERRQPKHTGIRVFRVL